MQVIDALFDTTGLEADAAACQQKIAELTAGIQQLIHDNQRTACDQDMYQAQYAALEAQHQKTAARKQALDADIAAKHANAKGNLSFTT